MEDTTSQDTTHDLLLALAGRVDDDLLRWARELVALGEDARAVEMITASLVAARVVLPPPVHSALVTAAHGARTDLAPATALPAPAQVNTTEHRFAAPADDDPVAGALLDFPARPLTGCTVLLARRLTPAGSAPGPLPHPVVLVRVHDRTRHAEVLAYQLGAALDRAGAPASVEVLPADGPLPQYHAAALDAAVELRHEAGDDRPWRPSPQAAVRPAPAPAPERHAFAPAPHPLAADPPRPAPRPVAPEPEPPADDPAAATVRLRPAPREDDEPEPLVEEHADHPTEDTTEDTTEARVDEEIADADTDERPYELEDELEDERAEDDHDEEQDDEAENVEAEDDELEDIEPEDDEPGDVEPGDVEPEDVEDDFASLPSPHPLAPPRPLPVRDAARPTPPTPLTPRTARPQPAVTPISRSVPNPIPLVRRSGPNPIARPVPVNESRPSLRRVDPEAEAPERPADERAPEEPRPVRRETSALDSLSDPLNGPLHQPLLAPLLDPTEDPLGLGPRRARPAPPPPQPAPAAQPDDEWSEEWLSGTWAMAPSVLEERRKPEPEPAAEPEPEPVEDAEPDRPAPRPVPRTPARHRFPDEPAPERDADDEPDDQDGEDREEIGLRSESVARLSDADRQLLARLQAELLEGHRQRIGRRITNGSHRGSPPDLGA